MAKKYKWQLNLSHLRFNQIFEEPIILSNTVDVFVYIYLYIWTLFIYM